MTEHTLPFAADRTFKNTLQLTPAAIDFVKAALPMECQSLMNLDGLRIAPSEYQLKAPGKQITSDVVLEVPLKSGKDGFIYIVTEYQSTPDETMPLRLLEMKTGIFRRYVSNNNEKFSLPLIVPIVISAYPHGYKKSTCLLDGFAPEHRDLMRSYLTEPMPLIDLSVLSDSEVESYQLSSMMMYAFKHIKSLGFPALLEGIGRLACQLEGNPSSKVLLMSFEHVLDYLLEKAVDVPSIEDLDNVVDEAVSTLPPYLEEAVESVKSILIARGEKLGEERGEKRGEKRGEELGLKQGRTEQASIIARNLLKAGMSDDQVALHTQLPAHVVHELKSSLEVTQIS